jgi:D-cysteine desulfhydrase
VALSFALQYLRGLVPGGRPPYFVYPGGSSTPGVLGYVNAAMEIRDQLARRGQAPPEAIFVAVGSCGTFAGLLLGARLAELPSRIVGVRVIERDVANEAKVARQANRAARYLRRRDPAVARVRFQAGEVELLDGYLGPAYAHATAEAEQAVSLLQEHEGLPLETTYTGKAMAALLDHARRHPGARLLFVDTYSEAPPLPEGDYHDLPEKFWPVFDRSHRVRCWCLRSRRDPAFCWKRGATGSRTGGLQ